MKKILFLLILVPLLGLTACTKPQKADTSDNNAFSTPDKEGVELLDKKMQSLAISYLSGDESSPLASEVSGKTFTLEQNERSIKSISFNFEGSTSEITITTDRGEQSFKAAYQQMEKGTLSTPTLVSDKVSATGAWVSADTYMVKLVYYETPESTTFTFRFEDGQLFWDTERKASFGPGNPAQLKATM